MTLKNIQAIFFDFDGVIADSVHVKTEAFAKIYEPFGEEVVKKVVDHHLANGGISRFEKFRLYHRRFLNQNLNDKQLQQILDNFSSLVLQRVIEAPLIPGTIEFLEKNYQNLKLFIISATPHDEINKIVKEKNLNKYFKNICGSPQNKSFWTHSIINEIKLDSSKVIFIGDALADYNAATENNIKFVARVNTIGDNIFNGKKVFKEIKDLFELDVLLLNGLSD